MGTVVIVCPHSGQEISTGIEMDSDSFKKLPDILVRSLCPSCGLQHAWWTREARLQESAAMSTQVRESDPAQSGVTAL